MAHKHKSEAPSWAKRPFFREEQRLTPERLNRVHDNHAARLRHALLGIAGPGIVYGYDIDTDDDEKCRIRDAGIHVSCGLAIDCHGRQLYWPGGWITLRDFAEQPQCEGHYTLTVHYAERREDVEDGHGCDDDESDWIEEGVVFTLTPGCKPTESECPDHCGECVDTTNYMCGRLGAGDGVISPDTHLEKLCSDPGKLDAVGCDDWLYDPNAGVDLACVEICAVTDPRQECLPEFVFCETTPKICEHRSFVYRNPLLFELIQGCHLDLAHVESLSFGEWLERDWNDPVPWAEFKETIRRGLSVRFSKPIHRATLTPASVFVTVVVREPESFFQDVLRLPVSHMEPLDVDGDYARGVHLGFHEKWFMIQTETDLSRFGSGAIIEFNVRCAMLRDECGNMADGRPLSSGPRPGGSHDPGDSMLGADFVVAFCVESKPRDEEKGGDASQGNSNQTS